MRSQEALVWLVGGMIVACFVAIFSLTGCGSGECLGDFQLCRDQLWRKCISDQKCYDREYDLCVVEKIECEK